MAPVRIEVAQEAGTCFGVERALELALEAARDATGPVHTMGPLIHNPQVVAELESQGVTVVDGPDVEAGATLLLRAHGVTPEVERRAAEAGAKVVDATCPFVKKVHQTVERLSAEGYEVVIVGEQGHPEVEGTVGHAPEAHVVGSVDELPQRLGRRVGVVAQTTLATSVLTSVVTELVRRCDEVRVHNTICSATAKRQQAAAELASRADVMVVVGGCNSANTTHLAQICAESCPATHHVETPDELDPAWFAGAGLVGVTAGASTPKAQIDAMCVAIEAAVKSVRRA